MLLLDRMKNDLAMLPFASGKLFIVENYLGAAGIMAALKAGVSAPSVRRPMAGTPVTTEPTGSNKGMRADEDPTARHTESVAHPPHRP